MACIKCGCTDNDCRQCVAAQGEPCHWVADGKCSRCFDEDGNERPVNDGKLFDDGWLYERNDDNSARFVLGQPGNMTLACFGVNPSTAEPDKLDSTLRRVKGFAKQLGYDGWLMLNVYAQRATIPDDLPMEWDNLLHAMNRGYIYQTFMKLGAVTVWAAWGTLIEKRPYLALCLREIVADSKCRPLQWITIGDRSQAGHPHHPLYLPNDAEAAPFDIDEYLQGLCG